MLLSILYALVRLLVDLVLVRCRHNAARGVELLVLRHEVRVLRRTAKRTRWLPGDRLVLTILSRLCHAETRPASQAACRSYSWMRPSSRSRRTISTVADEG